MTSGQTGVRFSLNYLSGGPPIKDGARFRKRLYSLFKMFRSDDRDFQSIIELEVGCNIPWGGYGPSWDEFFRNAELRDILDTITVIFNVLDTFLGSESDTWLDGVNRIFREESLGYIVDEAGGVHYRIDDEFEAARRATILALGKPRYDAARHAFESAHLAFDESPADTRAAIRHIFDAVETVFRLLLGDNVSRLGASEIDKKLRPNVLSLYKGAAHDNAGLLLKSFREWVNAGHLYRHAQAVEKREPPPIELAVLSVSSGAAFLRWLIDVDQRAQELMS